jgi:hypothetical protein
MLFEAALQAVFYPNLAALLAPDLRSVACVNQQLASLLHDSSEANPFSCSETAYKFACQSSHCPRLASLTDPDVNQTYRSWRSAYNDCAANALCDAKRVNIDISPLTAALLRLSHGVVSENEEDSTAMSSEFEMAESTWRLRLRVGSNSGALGLHLINMPLYRHASTLAPAQVSCCNFAIHNDATSTHSRRCEHVQHQMLRMSCHNVPVAVAVTDFTACVSVLVVTNFTACHSLTAACTACYVHAAADQ